MSLLRCLAVLTVTSFVPTFVFSMPTGAESYRMLANGLTRSILVLVTCVVLVAAFATAAAADVLVALVRLTTPVAPFSDATLEAKTSPGAACTLTVLYKSGASRARGLVPREANSYGRVSWTWRVGSNTTPGKWPVIVRCSVRDDVGEVRTLLEVR